MTQSKLNLTIQGALITFRTVSVEQMMDITGIHDFPALREACEQASRRGLKVIPTATGWTYR
jgi:hypothetical protein